MNDKETKDVWSHDEDTHERKKREMITETAQKRLKRKRTREGGTRSGRAATESDEPDDL